MRGARVAEYTRSGPALYVLGARKRDIRRLFLWESLLLGASGASTGCLFALAVGVLLPAGLHTALLFISVLLIAGLLAHCSALLFLRKWERAGCESLL